MTIFTETDLEQATLEWLEELGVNTANGSDLAPEGTYPERKSYSDIVLLDRLRATLVTLNPHLPADSIDDAIRQITTPVSPSLIVNNQAFHKLITDGIDVAIREDSGTIRYDKAALFDFNNPQNNDWLAVNQFTVIEGKNEKRPDIIIFVNGLPLVVIELKSSSNESVGISEAYNQLQTYKETIPSLFHYNCALIISDGINARIGALTASYERFMLWRTIDGIEVAPLSIPQLEVLLRGIFTKEIFLDLIKNFILFQSDGDNTYKILAGYHQFHAVNKALKSTISAASIGGDQRAGVIWHTQGSGKSLSMAFYAGKLIASRELKNPTIVVITDRNDLDDQLYATFVKSKDILRQSPEQASNRAELRCLLNRESGGVIFTTIHKFSPTEDNDTMPILTNRHNVIVIVDEAHRSQYGFSAEITNGKNPAAVKYGYAKYMRDSLPNASYIGFTGTPIELSDKNTQAVFGDYIDIYDMTRAVEDGTTVRIYYESRIAKLELPDKVKELLDEEYDEITEYQEQSQREQLKSKWSRLEAIVGAESRIKLVARDLVEHWEERQASQESIPGKAMIVAMSRRIAIALYNEIIRLRPDWHSDDLNKGAIKVVMTGSSADDPSWQKYIGTKQTRDTIANRMKNNDDELKIVIVRDMWLTGFDVPSMNTIYVDKPMSGHNLMQAIARVNRVFKDKQGGLVVDYIGIAENLKQALSNYTENDRNTAGIDTSVASDLLIEKLDLIHELLHGCDYNGFRSDKATVRMQSIVATVDYVISLRDERKKDYLKLVTELAKAFSLCATTDIAAKHNLEVGFHKAVKAGIIKMIPEADKKKTGAQLDAQINQLISKSLVSNEVVDILGAVGLDKQNIAILSDEFLEEVRRMPHKNLAVELLNKLLAGKVKNIARKNLIQSKRFSEKLESSIKKYQNRTIETTQVILELIELAKQINEGINKGSETGLTDDEIAFYDALADNQSASEVLGDDTLRQIAKELTRAIKNEMSVDWWIRESVQAKMRQVVRRLLAKYGYPPDKSRLAVEQVMQQARAMCEEL
ncbi:type I restriction endonuclease subunit R [Aquella oligotrophica]|uniref:Type I restriction enzyme endonuclease subunit n=1 Tax=Aquella oligotrophica TaxID=2067065 RepID=A0A2I7N7B7_9NEIS|nr:type I restriction endonuclease subunit R [Aquella oligotrophica]AUR52358.1 DEAD/DEAH box helicase [Aquella oligotrophica]